MANPIHTPSSETKNHRKISVIMFNKKTPRDIVTRIMIRDCGCRDAQIGGDAMHCFSKRGNGYLHVNTLWSRKNRLFPLTGFT